MSAGLYSREVVATFLGKRVAEIDRMVEEDGLPAVGSPSSTRERKKFAASQLCDWLNKRSNVRWTVEMLVAELERCKPQEGRDELAATLGLVVELRSLCDAAQAALSAGRACPRVMGAIQELIQELNQKGKAA